jgi:hypothetical protein
MNRRDAKAKSLEGTLSIGDLRAMISDMKHYGGMSTVNPTIPLERACDIYEAALKGRDDAEIILGTRPDVYRPGRVRRTGDGLIVQNILRDCA